jgi:hypothetical protein
VALDVPTPEPVAVFALRVPPVAVLEPTPEPVAVLANVATPSYERLLAL